jgi:Phage Tail Collar Domain
MRRQTFLTAGAAAALASCGHAAQMLPGTGSGLASGTSGTDTRKDDPALPLPKNPILGEVRRFDGKVPPRGWSFCDGSLLAIALHKELFSILGKSAGGARKKTFRLPNMRRLPHVISTGGKYMTSPKMLAQTFAVRKSP